jgi:hypothetical protein
MLKWLLIGGGILAVLYATGKNQQMKAAATQTPGLAQLGMFYSDPLTPTFYPTGVSLNKQSANTGANIPGCSL